MPYHATQLANSPDPAVDSKIVSLLTAFTTSEGEHISNSWRDLFPVLLTTYRDGYVMKNLDQPTIAFDRMFYPRWWLEAVGYFKIAGNRDGILFSDNPSAGSGSGYVSAATLVSSLLSCALLCGLAFGYVGFRMGKASSAVTALHVAELGEAEHLNGNFVSHGISLSPVRGRQSQQRPQNVKFAYSAIPDSGNHSVDA